MEQIRFVRQTNEGSKRANRSLTAFHLRLHLHSDFHVALAFAFGFSYCSCIRIRIFILCSHLDFQIAFAFGSSNCVCIWIFKLHLHSDFHIAFAFSTCVLERKCMHVRCVVTLSLFIRNVGTLHMHSVSVVLLLLCMLPMT